MTRLMLLVVRIFGRLRLNGRARVPAEGPLLVVANHLNIADPPLLGAVLPRRIHFMAKLSLFDQRPFGFFVRLFGAFPVRRYEADLKALRQAQEILEAGGVVGLFPEGHRSHGEGLIQPFPGPALVALRTGVTILPVAITGTETIRRPSVLLRHPLITVTIGEPFTLTPPSRINGAAVRAATDEIMYRLAALLPAEYRGLYGTPGRPVLAAPPEPAEATG